ncbi:MAG: hypothetical protein QME06_05755 [Desulfobacterales bacterium]|nr:hypothetical protein [Desulfobacterales bacterium]
MKKLQAQLKSISKSLVALSKQVDKISDQMSKQQAPKKTTIAKKVKTATAKTKKTSANKKTTKKETALEAVFNIIKRSKKGATIVALKEKTGLISRQLSNALYKLGKKGQIIAKERGLYIQK